MAKLISKQDLFDYCIRKLGAPFVEVNVTDEQLEDRFEDAWLMFTQHHYDATELVYLKHIITADDMNNIDANGRFLTIDDRVISITRIFHLSTLISSSYLFDIKYQMWVSQLWDFTNVQLQYYNQVRTHLRNIELIFNGEVPIRYQRHGSKLYLDTNWQTTYFVPGEAIVMEGYAMLNPEPYPNLVDDKGVPIPIADQKAGIHYFPDVYNDMWLKQYLTALIKKQWAENLGKFGNIQLPGGITLNSERMYTDASQDIVKLESELYEKYSLPPTFFVG